MILGWAMLRRPRAEWEQVLEAIRRSQATAELLVEVEQMAEQTQMTWEQELLARGRTIGEARGATAALRKTLAHQLQQKFGPLPEEVRQRIAAAELPALEAALDRVLSLNSLDELNV